MLLPVELVADKVPMLDHLNDAVQTLIGPTSGGLAFGATAGGITVITDRRVFLATGAWRTGGNRGGHRSRRAPQRGGLPGLR